ncbi:MAG: hypothetical protein HYY40_13220 [Bacteroidetes bacterium]|nr:hypothetical protein [Bacteroidota bacterium]
MDFDNILYIIAIAAYILYSFFGKKKKKPATDETASKGREKKPHPEHEKSREIPEKKFPPANWQSERETGRHEDKETREEEKREKSAEEIFKEIFTALGGEPPEVPGQTETPRRKIKKPAQPAKHKVQIPTRTYETLESVTSLESAGSLETYEKPVSSEIISSETASLITRTGQSAVSGSSKPATVSEEPSHPLTGWQQAVILSEILGKPRAVSGWNSNS